MERKKGVLYAVGVAILIFVAIGFFGTPLAGVFGPQNRAAIHFGRYGSESIVYIPGNYFSQQLEQIAGRLIQPGQSSDAFFNRLVWRQGFDATVLHLAILRQAQRSRLDISESGLDKRIAQHPRFQDADGFDSDAYRALSGQERSRFRALERELYVRETYLADLADGALLSDTESDFFKDIALEERKIAFTVVLNDEIDDDAIVEYIDTHPALFEYMRVGIIEIAGNRRAAEQLREQIADDGTNFYEKRGELNTAQELDVESESEWLFFSELDDRYLQAEGLEQLRSLSLNEVSPLISYGDERYAVFLIEQRQDASQVESDELYSYARDYIDANDADYRQQQLMKLIDARKILVTDDASLIEVGIRNGFTVESSDYFPLNYGNIDLYTAVASDSEGYLDGVERNREFLRQVFSLERGELSEPIPHRSTLILLQIQDIRTVDPEEYDRFDEAYQNQMNTYDEDALNDALVQRDRLLDNFDEIYDELIAAPEQ